MRLGLRPLPVRFLYGGIGGALALVFILASRTMSLKVVSVAAVGLFAIAGMILGRKEETLAQRASTDPLTGVANRRHFDGCLRGALQVARRGHMPMSVLFVDVDHLKEINDQLGHAAGDAVLKLVGDTLGRTCRSRDLPARWGGDEFVVLAPWTSSAEALVLANRIRAMLPRVAAERRISPVPTVSIGVAELARVESSSPELLMCAADDALYQAKMRGRDRVEIAAVGRHRKHNPELRNLRTRPIRTPPIGDSAGETNRGERI